ncbi:VWA domain-containing protein [Biformimicrobium ophioploci]|uniref:VWFA domain-containing protein n=1 Tax=Biformimicrobium ophioploci TaxID=3036711 RepID=A0ABQ6LYL3_9GAMM|nr:VWA domain-containing protein [Microbulbifer sp. NKW57]GMG87171.1 hypothetical protein MNKW57_14920 [Microbulbifer sp. NKW57]
MARRKRRFNAFSLSFLDIMSCGFGAVALIFLIIKHDADNQVVEVNQDLKAEVNLLEEEVTFGREQLVLARNTLDTVSDDLADAQGLARRIQEQIDDVRGNIAEIDSSDLELDIKKLQEKIKKMEDAKEKLEAENRQLGNNVRKFIGDGDRQYLTGLKLGGDRVLILMDRSASMLGDKLINVIRRRNMSTREKRASPKWVRSIDTVSWISAQLPSDSRYQIYAFNTEVESAIPGTEGNWLNIDDRDQLDQAIENVREMVPENGTSLERVFAAVRQLSPMPDNIILLTDGLPTQGMERPKANNISGRDRIKLFQRAVKLLPESIPVNVILAPMEGDPYAASEFWRLAQDTRGSFLSPSRDWP